MAKEARLQIANAKFLYTHTGTTCRRESSPPQLRRGGRDIKKKTAEPPLKERTGWCWSKDA